MPQMTRRIYADTSVIGGCLDEEFEFSSRLLLRRFSTGQDILVISDLTHLELVRAPQEVREILESVAPEFLETIEFTREASDLARSYIETRVIGAAKQIDAQHIAPATVHRVDVLVSWNFKHIVNLERIHGYNSVNLRYGYPLLEIRTPREVIPYEETTSD